MALSIALFAFGLLATAILYYGRRVYLKPGRVFEQVGQAIPGVTAKPGQQTTDDGMVVRAIRMIGEKVPISPADTTLTRRYLMAAGFRSEKALASFYGIKVLLLGVMLVMGVMLRGNVTANPTLGWVIAIGVGLFGWYVPGLVLERLVSARQERIRFSLPDALDMIVICVEAGHGLDQAFV